MSGGTKKGPARRSLTTAAVSAAVALTAALGASGAGAYDLTGSDSRITADPDNTPPTITARAPANGAAGVATTTNVLATFNEPMDEATLDGARVELRDPGNNLVPATISYSASLQRLTLNPVSSLANSTLYEATVKGGAGGVADLAGNELAADSVWSFTAAPPPRGYELPAVAKKKCKKKKKRKKRAAVAKKKKKCKK